MKAHNFHFVVLVLSTPLLYSEVNFKRYENDAKHWIEQHVVNDKGALIMSPADFHMILNLVYFSYERSAATLRAQKAGLNALSNAWQGYQNIAQTRLNPAHDLPFSMQATCNIETFNLFVQEQINHRHYGLTYVQALKYLLEGSTLSNSASSLAIEKLRVHARSIVIDSFLSLKQQLAFLTDCVDQLSKQGDLNEEDRGLKDFFSFLPGFALSSFLKLESCYVTASTKGWSALEQVQLLMARLYEAIEQERASFYGAHYRALMEILKKSNMAKSYYLIAFNEKGIIPPKLRKEKLPSLN